MLCNTIVLCLFVSRIVCFFFFKQKTAYEMRISDWSSDVCSSDLAPDDDLPQLKAISSEALRGLALRDGGMDCSVSMFDYALRREKQCRTDPKSYGRLNLACRFTANKASVGATMVAQGYAVDYRIFSGGAYVELMQKAAAHRDGLCGVDYEGMRQLAVSRAPVPRGCRQGTIKK